MQNIKLSLLQKAFDISSVISLCPEKTLEESFVPDRLEENMLFYFLDVNKVTHVIKESL